MRSSASLLRLSATLILCCLSICVLVAPAAADLAQVGNNGRLTGRSSGGIWQEPRNVHVNHRNNPHSQTVLHARSRKRCAAKEHNHIAAARIVSSPDEQAQLANQANPSSASSAKKSQDVAQPAVAPSGASAAAAASPSPSGGASKGAMGGVSQNCSTAIGQIVGTQDLAQCMGLDDLTTDDTLAPLLSGARGGGGGNASLIGPMGKYLSQTLCIRPVCNPSTLNSSLATLTKGCSKQELSSTTSSAALLSRFLSSYATQRDMACLVNMTTPTSDPFAVTLPGDNSPPGTTTIQGHPLCSLQLFAGLQNITGSNMGLNGFFQMQSNDPAYWTPVLKKLSASKDKKVQAPQKDLLCSDCHKAMLTQLFYPAYKNESKTLPDSSSVKKSMLQMCGGKAFGDGKISDQVKQAGVGAGFMNLNQATNGTDTLSVSSPSPSAGNNTQAKSAAVKVGGDGGQMLLRIVVALLVGAWFSLLLVA